jgi:hypothetical protein
MRKNARIVQEVLPEPLTRNVQARSQG